MEAVDRDAIGIERALVLWRSEALAHLIIVTGAQIEGRGGDRMARCREALGVRAHLVANRDAGVGPYGLRRGLLFARLSLLSDGRALPNAKGQERARCLSHLGRLLPSIRRAYRRED